nr:hypothetical protein [uncultured Moellerella sp.]
MAPKIVMLQNYYFLYVTALRNQSKRLSVNYATNLDIRPEMNSDKQDNLSMNSESTQNMLAIILRPNINLLHSISIFSHSIK